MTSRRVFYGTFAVVFLLAVGLMAALGFDPDPLPEWCTVPLYPGLVYGFLLWWTFGLPAALAILGGCFVLALSYAVLVLAGYGVWHLFHRRDGRSGE